MRVTFLSKVLSPARAALIAAVSYAETVDQVFSFVPSIRYSILALGALVLAYSLWKGIRGWQYYRTIRAITSPLSCKNEAGEKTRFLVRHPHNFDELATALEEDRHTYEVEAQWPISRWRDFYEQNPEIAFMLIDQTNGGECIGGISLFPLREKIAAKLCAGALKETELRGEDLFTANEKSQCNHWHVGGIVLFKCQKTRLAKEMIAQTLILWLDGLSDPFPITLTAFAYSDMGGKLLKKLGFSKVAELSLSNNALPLYRLILNNATELKEQMSPLMR